MSIRNRVVGRWGELKAADFLACKGYIILGTNVRTPHGEIDLVALKGEQVVFVEVKTRTSRTYGLPEDSITPRKQSHMMAAAECYLESHPSYDEWQFDVIAVERLPHGRTDIQHFENIFG